jgi:predicted phosphodiesterase
MKLRILSDLHLEFMGLEIEHAGEDIILLCGDIGVHTMGMDFAQKVARVFEVPVLMLAGNHEFYQNYRYPHHTWESTLLDLRAAADHTSLIKKGEVTFLENNSLIYEGVRFIGATLWTDMKLFGDDGIAEWRVGNALNDYRVIFSERTQEILNTQQTIERHGESRAFIEKALEEPFDGKTVVLTHHTPSWLSVPEPYRSDKVSAGYSSRLEPIIEKFQPAVWCHGHTHTSFDYTIGDTRIICNPRGYAEIDPNLDFKIDLIVEV